MARGWIIPGYGFIFWDIGLARVLTRYARTVRERCRSNAQALGSKTESRSVRRAPPRHTDVCHVRVRERLSRVVRSRLALSASVVFLTVRAKMWPVAATQSDFKIRFRISQELGSIFCEYMYLRNKWPKVAQLTRVV
eukprot:3527244-Prymnesium_polylepis.1